MIVLDEIDHICRFRQSAHSHAATSPGALLSLSRQSCVGEMTRRNREFALCAAIFFSSPRGCSKAGNLFRAFFRKQSASLSYRRRPASSFLIDTYELSASRSAVPDQQREADGGNYRGCQDRDRQNHRTASFVVLSNGGVTCTGPYEVGRKKPAKSNASWCRALQEFAVLHLEGPGKAFSRSKLLKNWLRALAVRSGLLPTRSAANTNLPQNPCKPSSTSALIRPKRRAF